MSDLKIAIIIGSTRPGRKGPDVAKWVAEQASGRAATYEIVDLKDFALPLLDEPVPPSMGQYQHDHTKKWSEKIAQYDGYVFVTAEYNHSVPGALKNAIDYLYQEWNNKGLALVGYGSLGGSRAIEHLRGIAGELQLADVRQQLSFSLFTDFKDFAEFAPAPLFEDAAKVMFDQLEAWSAALKPLRQK